MEEEERRGGGRSKKGSARNFKRLERKRKRNAKPTSVWTPIEASSFVMPRTSQMLVQILQPSEVPAVTEVALVRVPVPSSFRRDVRGRRRRRRFVWRSDQPPWIGDDGVGVVLRDVSVDEVTVDSRGTGT